jgi:hypothetical protein
VAALPLPYADRWLLNILLLTLENKENDVWFYFWKVWGTRSF